MENKNENKNNKIDFTAFKPDEIYIITRKDNNNSKVIIKVIEKKNQNVAGSTDEKLRTAEFFRKAYPLTVHRLLKSSISGYTDSVENLRFPTVFHPKPVRCLHTYNRLKDNAFLQDI